MKARRYDTDPKIRGRRWVRTTGRSLVRRVLYR
jgi:hypothetical protein